MKTSEILGEKWSAKYKRSIDCNNPKGFSQRAHCAGRKKNESIIIEDGWWDAYRKIRDSGDDVAPYLKSLGWDPYSKKDVTQFIDKSLSHPSNQTAAKYAMDIPMWMIAGAAQKHGINADELKSMIDIRDQYKRQNPEFVTQFRNDPVSAWQKMKTEAVQQELPIDLDRIRDLIQRLESNQTITPQEADDMRRAAQALASGRDTILPDRLLQLLTMVA